jgi:hypothetical protein
MVFDVRAEAVVVISDALQWRLTAARWQAIEELLAAMDAALAADDLEALAAAITDLELAGPVRITRIGAAPAVPAPPQVRDRLNRLVNSLGGTSAPNRGESGQQTGEDDRDAS